MNPRINQVTQLRDDRARHLAAMDDVVETVRSERREMTSDERADFDFAERRVHEIDRSLSLLDGTSARSPYASVNVNRISSGDAPAVASRSLDELLWATSETVATPTGAANPVDQVVIRSAGQLDVRAPRINELGAEHREAVRSFQRTVAEMALFGLMVDKTATTSAEGFEVARAHPLMADRWKTVTRALDVDTSGEGGTWVPTGIGASIHEKVRQSGKIAPLFARIDLPSNPWKFPIQGADSTAYRVAEPTSDTATKVTASTPGTVAATFDAEIFGGRVIFSRALDADSAAAIVPWVTGNLVQAFVDAEEKAILDGDTDGTHQDSDVGASTTDARTAWDGLRKWGLANGSVATTTTTAANLALVRKQMGKWGVNPNELAFIVGVGSLHALLTDTNLLTVDKMGPNAVLLNGQIGSLYGAPVIVSEHVREDLNASGVADAITTTKSYLMCVHRPSWIIGQRMAIDVEIDPSIYRESYQVAAVAFSRLDVQPVTPSSTDDIVGLGINVTSGS